MDPSWKSQDWLPWARKYGEKKKLKEALFVSPALSVCCPKRSKLKTNSKPKLILAKQKNKTSIILTHQITHQEEKFWVCRLAKCVAGRNLWFLCFICFGHRFLFVSLIRRAIFHVEHIEQPSATLPCSLPALAITQQIKCNPFVNRRANLMNRTRKDKDNAKFFT
jgi:hypothetical protein